MSEQKEQNSSSILRFLEKKLQQSNYSTEQKRKIIIGADISINVLIVVFLVILIRGFIMSPFQVYGISMCNTLNFVGDHCVDGYGDYIIINKAAYLRISEFSLGTPQRGDIVVFRPPQNSHEFYIKRVIALPGEKVKLIDGFVYVYNDKHPEGVKINETYLNSDNNGGTFATGGIDEFQVPAGHYFVLGDNRKRSSDSRLCFKESAGSPGCGENGITPYLSIENFEGKAALVLWPQPRALEGHNYPEIDN